MHNLLSKLNVLFAVVVLARATCVYAQTAADHSEPSASDVAISRVVSGIISFTRWPAPISTVRLCVVGDVRDWKTATSDPALPSSPPVSIKSIAASDDGLMSACDALYLGALADGERRALLQRTTGHPFLTIAEQDRSCTSGAMFCINATDAHVRFDVNIDSVSRSGVHVSPKVLELARKLNTP